MNQSALKSVRLTQSRRLLMVWCKVRCSNCVLACPFGVPKYRVEINQMMKCDMCYDRTSVGKRPMCATVCPSGALTYTTRENIERTRQGLAIRDWQFGGEAVRTKVNVLVPRSVERIDVGLEQLGIRHTDEYDVAALLTGD
jgi:Fe-S-cluster-containing dehydrogenase component